LHAVRDSGRVFVVFGATDQPNARARPTNEATREAGGDRLYEEMRERIAYLERQVEEEREARRRADTLLVARLMDRLPELEAPSDERESPQTGEEVRGEPRGSDAPGAHSEATGVRRPWWRRLFGGG
jgi:hypothetical protein